MLYPVTVKTCTTHEYGQTLSYDASGHWYECSVCHDRKDFAAHTWDGGKVTKKATTSPTASAVGDLLLY